MRQVPASDPAFSAPAASGRHAGTAFRSAVSAPSRRRCESIAPDGGHSYRIAPRVTWRTALVSLVANPLCLLALPMALAGARFGAAARAGVEAYAQRS
jgi:hypothetical protein